MIELRGVVASVGAAAVTAVLRPGEVVRLDGPPAAVAALFDVLAGRRAPRAGCVVWRGGGAPVLVRAGERLAGGVDAADAIALWAALAGPGGAAAAGAAAPPPSAVTDAEAAAATRGLGLPAATWLVDGALGAAAETIVQRAAETVRAGAGVMVWTGGAGRERVDRVVTIERGAAAPAAPAAPAAAAGDRRGAGVAWRWAWRALVAHAGAAATTRVALGLGALAALWLALAATSAVAHEGYWYAEGDAAGVAQLVGLGGLGAVLLAATATAVRAAAAAAWPAMLRETGAPLWVRWGALVAGDGGGAAVAAAVAALPAVWARQPIAGTGAALAVVLAAAVAGAVTRVARGVAAVGALAGIAVGAALLW